MSFRRIINYASFIFLFLAVALHVFLEFSMGVKDFSPNTWEAIDLLRKNDFLDMKVGDTAKFAFQGEILEVIAIPLKTKSEGPQFEKLKHAIVVSFRKTPPNEVPKIHEIVFGVEENEGKTMYPILTIRSYQEGKI